MDADDAVLFLNGAEDEIFLRGELAAAAPFDGVAAQRPPPEILRVDAVENRLEVEIFPLVVERQHALQGCLGMSNFTL